MLISFEVFIPLRQVWGDHTKRQKIISPAIQFPYHPFFSFLISQEFTFKASAFATNKLDLVQNLPNLPLLQALKLPLKLNLSAPAQAQSKLTRSQKPKNTSLHKQLNLTWSKKTNANAPKKKQSQRTLFAFTLIWQKPSPRWRRSQALLWCLLQRDRQSLNITLRLNKYQVKIWKYAGQANWNGKLEQLQAWSNQWNFAKTLNMSQTFIYSAIYFAGVNSICKNII